MEKTQIKRFTVYRTEDISLTHTHYQVNPSDEPQYEGVVFSDGTCVLRWLTAMKSTSVWNSFEEAMRVHGHPEYGIKIIWHDESLNLWWENEDSD